MVISENNKKIGEKIKSLDLNHENGLKYRQHLEENIAILANTLVENGHILIFGITQCACGCGDTIFVTNKDILTKQQTVKLLKEIQQQIEIELSQLN